MPHLKAFFSGQLELSLLGYSITDIFCHAFSKFVTFLQIEELVLLVSLKALYLVKYDTYLITYFIPNGNSILYALLHRQKPRT